MLISSAAHNGWLNSKETKNLLALKFKLGFQLELSSSSLEFALKERDFQEKNRNFLNLTIYLQLTYIKSWWYCQ
jgi:hypothetical protein